MVKYKNPIVVISGHYHATKIRVIGNLIFVSTPSMVTYPMAFRHIKITNYKDRVHYNFDFIIPINIYLRDTFVNPINNKAVNFFAYYLERLGMTENRTTLIMTDYESSKYDSIDSYLADMRTIPILA